MVISEVIYLSPYHFQARVNRYRCLGLILLIGILFSLRKNGYSTKSSYHEASTLNIYIMHNIIVRKRTYTSEQTVFQSWSKDVLTQITPSLRQNCSRLVHGDAVELERVQQLLSGLSTFYIDESLSNCNDIKREFSNNFYVSEKEKVFPIAYVLLVHTNIYQVLRFLKTIYRSHNLYCIHPDLSSGSNFTKQIHLLSHCLPNVFIPSAIHDVQYRKPGTIFEAQMSCFRELEDHPYTKWQYVINLCGRELPLKTNRFIIESLEKLDEVSVMNTFPSRIDNSTVKFIFFKAFSTTPPYYSAQYLEEYSLLKTLGFKIYKSLTYNALSWAFVTHFLHDQSAQLLGDWLIKNCRTPEEFFYSMVYMKPGTPGGYNEKTSFQFQPLHVSMIIWKHDISSHNYEPGETCQGTAVHQVCILNSAELPHIYQAMSRNVLFFNKYYMEEDHVVAECVEEELIRMNKQEYVQDYEMASSHTEGAQRIV